MSTEPEGPGRRRRLAFDVAVGLVVVVALATAGLLALSGMKPHQTQASASSSPSAQSSGRASPSTSHSASPSPSRSASPTPAKTPAKPAASPAPPAPTGPPHIMVIVEENNGYGAIIGNSQLPYINSLARTYGLATNWWDVSHPSEPNYLAMISGSVWDNPQDLTPQDETYAGP